MPIRIFCHFLPSFLLVVCGSAFLFSQNQQPVSDPQAIALASQSVVALTNGSAVSDITLSGTVTWIAGSTNSSGSANLMAKGTAESRIDLNLSMGAISEIRNGVSGPPQGQSIQNGVSQSWPQQNCWTAASWFFPALSTLASTTDPSTIFVYVGAETLNGNPVHHIRTFLSPSGQRPFLLSMVQQVSATDFYLDATSLLPVEITFAAYPDGTHSQILFEVDFANYQPMGGVLVPAHIQKFASGGLVLDVVVTSASVNSGLADSLFSVQ